MASPAEYRPQNGPHGRSNAEQPTEVLAGAIERVTFHNPANGFCVLRIKARGHRDLFTVVGHAAEISAGEWVTVSGCWVNDREHGQQCPAAQRVQKGKGVGVHGAVLCRAAAYRPIVTLPATTGAPARPVAGPAAPAPANSITPAAAR